MKKILMGVGLVVLVIGIGVTVFVSLSQDSLNQLVKTPITDVDLQTIADGTYDGSYSAFPVTVQLKVTVKDHAITDIVIVKHDNGQGKPAEAILEDILEEQSLEVDVISGATYSSKVILLAIKTALAP